jgi:uncharacterized membrane protein
MSRPLREVADRRPGLEPPKFSLRALMAAMAVAALAITMGKWLGPLGAGVAVIGALSIIAHVAGAAIGGRLRARDAATLPRDDAASDQEPPGSGPVWLQPVSAHASDFAPPTKLSHHTPLQRKPVLICSFVAAALAAVAGAVFVAVATWQRVTVINVLFGAGSAAVLGGLFGFWASSLFQVVRSAWLHAHQEVT